MLWTDWYFPVKLLKEVVVKQVQCWCLGGFFFSLSFFRSHIFLSLLSVLEWEQSRGIFYYPPPLLPAARVRLTPGSYQLCSLSPLCCQRAAWRTASSTLLMTSGSVSTWAARWSVPVTESQVWNVKVNQKVRSVFLFFFFVAFLSAYFCAIKTSFCA